MRRRFFHDDDRCRRRPKRGGFTLLEVLIASVILSLAVAALSQAVVVGQVHTYDSLHRMRGTALAQALMAEVTALSYPVVADGQSSPPKPSSRLLYDSMDDFDGYVEAAGDLSDQTGRAYDTPYQLFARKVTAVTKTVAINGLGNIAGLEVTVTVIDEKGLSRSLVRFIPSPTGEGAGADS